MDFQNNTTQIILAIIAVFAVGIIVKISINKNNKKTSNSKNLNNVNAGGDIVFGNKKTDSADLQSVPVNLSKYYYYFS